MTSQLAAAASETCISRDRLMATILRASGVLCFAFFFKTKDRVGIEVVLFGLSLAYDIAAAFFCADVLLLRWHDRV